jgi:DNA-binding protein H-NS
MSKLAALKKQIAALEARAERIAKEEMSSAIAKVKDIMAEFNLTIEHLTQTVAGKRAARKTKANAKTASVAKYADPKSGKTWSGFGRAPGWIVGAKNRDAFLVGKTAVADPEAKAPAAAKKASGKAAKAVKVAKRAAKPVVKKAVAAVKKASSVKAAPTGAKKQPAAKKVSAKKSASKRAASKRAAAAPVEPTAAPAA